MELVSIITPVYKCEEYIAKTMDSVLKQTYTNWEMLLVDDCSPDGSAEIVKSYAAQDSRFKYIKLKNNGGAAVARNVALDHAKGRYIAYLDADDIWLPKKLERQIRFMEDNNVQFSCCDYEKIEADDTPLNKIVHMPKTISYNQLLSNTIIQTVGVIVDLNKVDKKLLIMPNVRRGQDSATWLQMLRNEVKFTGQNEVLAQYRRVTQSLSANKFSAMKRTWYLYRGVEHLSLLKSCVCLIGWAYHASIKRIYIKKYKKYKK
ncbi:glycosyltransferase family 2 protein [Enterococcus faecium]|uniref:glycosyltransferase family 2 protein n=1 Tax=Enterococcus faecium TaxID=1352 RepID=UPI00227FA31F|nr:glycosyltransferase family 2 protein [Enterococcus faecium]MCU1817697.1 glycosyltransferase [Enterococcus faecium]MCY7002403.1 glycosyltransferase family 2 protein [Enterococcus faecium]